MTEPVRLGSVACLALWVAGCAGGPTVPNGKPPPRQPPENAVGGFSIDVPPALLMPGEETTPCWIFPLAVDGPSRFVGGGSLSPTPGLHHGNVTTRKKTGDGVRACPPGGTGSEAFDILEGGAVLFASSTQVAGEEWQSFPKGMAYRIKDGYEIVARMHYLNASTKPLMAAARYRWYTIAEGAVTEELAPFAWDFAKFSIPPRSEHAVRAECLIGRPMHLVVALPHMHRLGVEFAAGYLGGPLDGRRFLDSPGYDPEKGVMVQYEPAVDLSQGDGAWFSCRWNNDLDKTITQGIGDNEMCILFGYAYPPAGAFSARALEGSCVSTSAPQ